MDRRTLLRNSLLMMMGASYGYPVIAASQNQLSAEGIAVSDLVCRLAEIFPDLDHVIVIGNAYLKTCNKAPIELLELVAKRLELFSEIEEVAFADSSVAERGISTSTLCRRLVACVSEEFSRGETVEVDGWILARTEAQICGALST